MKKQYLFAVTLLLIGLCRSVSQAASCTERGRFPNDENQDCRGYITCLRGGIANFTQYKLTCPQGFVYNHVEQQCTNATNYKCYPSFNCTDVGNFTTPEIDNCDSYISCVMGMDDLSTARVIECPINTIFDSKSAVCVDRIQATCSNSNVNSLPIGMFIITFIPSLLNILGT